MEPTSPALAGSFFITELSEKSYICVCVRVLSSFSRVRLSVTIWPVAHQGPLSMGFSRQEYWNGLPFPSPGDLPDLGIEPRSPALQEDALPSEKLRESQFLLY